MKYSLVFLVLLCFLIGCNSSNTSSTSDNLKLNKVNVVKGNSEIKNEIPIEQQKVYKEPNFNPPNFVIKEFKVKLDNSSNQLIITFAYEITKSLYNELEGRNYYFSFDYPSELQQYLNLQSTNLVSGSKIVDGKLSYNMLIKEKLNKKLGSVEKSYLDNYQFYNLEISDEDKDIIQIFNGIGGFINYTKDKSRDYIINNRGTEQEK